MRLRDSAIIDTPGLYRMPAAAYHADACPTPSLSASIAKLLISRTPRHAWTAHPRLNPAIDPADEKRFDLGTAAHALLLGEGRDIAVLPYADYRKKEAQEERAAVLAAGQTPLLAEQYQRARVMVDAVLAQLALVEDCGTFADPDAISEAVFAWVDDNGVWCRGMADRMLIAQANGWIDVYDLKTTDVALDGSSLARLAAGQHYDLQAAFYIRGLSRVTGVPAYRIRFRHIFVEAGPPHLAIVAELDAAALVLGEKKTLAAIALWGRCLSENRWPGYPALPVTLSLPAWSEAAWLERELNDTIIADMGRDPFLSLSQWAPEPAPTPIAGPC